MILEGCLGGEPPPFTPSPLGCRAGVFAGTPLSGPRGPEEEESPTEGAGVRLEVMAFETMPEDLLAPLASEATLLAALDGERTLPPTVRASLSARCSKVPADAAELRRRLDAGDLGRVEKLGDLSTALRPGLTACFHLESRIVEVLPGAREPVRESIEARAALAAGNRLRVAILLTDRGSSGAVLPALEGETPSSAPEIDGILHRDTALLDLDATDGKYVVALVLRSPFDEHPGISLALFFEADALSSPEGPPEEGPGGASGRATERTGPIAEPSWSAFGRAVAALERYERRRSALVFLARETGATIACDASLELSDERLGELAERVSKQAAALPTPLEAGSVGWILERETYLFLLVMAVEGGEDAVTRSLLLTHAGELARHPASLEEVVTSATDLDSLAAAILHENLICLEDSLPSARVRAFDWLALRGKVPEGYDPLGPREERRDALRRAAEATVEEPVR